MNIKTLILGDLDTNCYILEKNGKQLIIDPAANFDIIKQHLNSLSGILITHYHFDHVGALEEVKDNYEVPIFNYKTLGIKKIEDFEFEVIEVKGHHETCVMFKFGTDMFVGDFIFENGIGRTDLETGDYNQMLKSLEKMKKYKNVTIYSGHGNRFYL